MVMTPSSTAKRPGEGSSRHGRRSMGRVEASLSHGNGLDSGAPDDEFEAERSRLISERQEALEGIADRHDSLVREQFHMEKFVTMLSYDPQVAKEDNSAVFREYKAGYDLLESIAPGSSSSRKTRKSQTERLSYLKSADVGAPAAKGYRKKNTSRNAKGDVIWSILAEAKGKGKEKNRALNVEPSLEHEESNVRPNTNGRVHEGHDRQPSEVFADYTNPSLRVGEPGIVSQGLKLRKRQSLDLAHSSNDLSISAHLGPPRKKRKTEPFPISTNVNDILPNYDVSPQNPHSIRSHYRVAPLSGDSLNTTSVTPDRVSNRLRNRPQESVEAPKPSSILATSGLTPSRSFIKRVKLIVRRPPPSFSHPRQRPPPPRHSESLSKFLSSYNTLHNEDRDMATLEKMALDEASLRDRIDKLRMEGRLFALDTGTTHSLANSGNGSSLPVTERRADPWHHVIEAVIAYSRVRKISPQQVAAQVASKVQTYWDGYSAREDKLRAQEGKRLRALAKATIKMVTNEWKKAVFHIREQERLKLEAEEMRRGHEHLDAILDQSGQILETQQVDLARGELTMAATMSRSRSSSISATLKDWTSMMDASREASLDDGDGEGEEDGQEEEEEGRRDNIVQTSGEEGLREEGGEGVHGEQEMGEEEEDASEQEEGSEDEGTSASALLSGVFRPSQSAAQQLDGDTPSVSQSASAEPLDMVDDLYLQDHTSSTLPDSEYHAQNQSLSGSVREEEEEEEDILVPDATELLYPSPQPSEDEVILHDDVREPSLIPAFQLPDISLDRSSGDAQPCPTKNSRFSSLGDDPLAVPPLPAKFVKDIDLPNDPVHHADPPSSVDGFGPTKPSPHPDSPLISTSVDISPSVEHDIVSAYSTPGSGGVLGSDVIEVDTRSFDHPTQISDKKSHSVLPNSPGKVALPEVLVPENEDEDDEDDDAIPHYLKPYAVAPVEWNPESKIKPPILLRGILRPYQQAGLEWLASLHTNNLNGILADEMGLGKTIQTISLLAHLACDRGIWGPHLIIVPTSVLLNWEMEFKKFLPGFKILSYHGTTKRRKELRQGWNDKHHFNVCITSYTLASRDAHIFKRKAWYYMVLDEAHMIKNFKSQRWNILLMFRSFRRLLLTGTPLQNNLTELWALLQFLMSGTNFANLKEFGEWFSNPLEKAIEMGAVLDDETLQRVSKLHTVLRPYLLRRLKRDVEKELPSKFDHLVLCPLSKRQRFLYDEFMARAQTQDALHSGVYQKIANILMQLRKVCNHPNLFEVRPIVTSLAMERSAIADFEIKELLVRRQLLQVEDEEHINLDVLGLRFIEKENTSLITALGSRQLDGTSRLPYISELLGGPPPKDMRTIAGYKEYTAYKQRSETKSKWVHIGYLNRLRCRHTPIYSLETIAITRKFNTPLLPITALDIRKQYMDISVLTSSAIKSYAFRAEEMASILDRFAFVTPAVVARDMPRIALAGSEIATVQEVNDLSFDTLLHRTSVKLQIAFPDPSLLQYDCGKLQELARLLQEKKAGGHRVLIFTQMTKILDILEIFLNFHGYLYLRLDGATKIEDRQYITERFNVDSRVFCFIASSRSGGVGINLTGADTVVFYDSDFNPQMDRQCEDRAHRIGQMRDVHIYRFISQHTVEEAMLRKANQKRSLDDLVIQKGEFDWRTLFGDESALTNALGEFEDSEDAHAAAVAAREEIAMVGADEADFEGDAVEGTTGGKIAKSSGGVEVEVEVEVEAEAEAIGNDPPLGIGGEAEDEDGGSTVDYMVAFVQADYDYFKDWRL